MNKRIVSNILFLIGFFFVPWWAGIFLIIWGVTLFQEGIEIIFYGICYDAVFGIGASSFSFYGTLYAVCIYSLGVFLAKRIA
jgi:multisubunit Na+/H+ antiporter MnhC subunit